MCAKMVMKIKAGGKNKRESSDWPTIRMNIGPKIVHTSTNIKMKI